MGTWPGGAGELVGHFLIFPTTQVFFFKLIFHHGHMCGSVCVYVYMTVGMHKDKINWSPGTGVTGACVQPNIGAGNNTWIL